MPLFPTEQAAAFARVVSKLAYANPFLPERLEFERQALGDAFAENSSVWSLRLEQADERPAVVELQRRVESLCADVRDRLRAGARPTAKELATYRDVVAYLLYYRTWRRFDTLIAGGRKADCRAFFDAFRHDHAEFLELTAFPPAPHFDPDFLFALFFQIRRAFHSIFTNIVGGSLAIARLRASIWQSLFSHDLARYQQGLFRDMSDTTTLITGPSGTGKELVARAIALSRFIPYNPDTGRFDFAPEELFYPLNLSALSPTLIESELFGHRRGAFTSALEDRTGWLEVCPPSGAVFLDEIGELDAQVQVKLLRVLQQRTFQRLGETRERAFKGKIIAATNRDLAAEIAAGRFCTDFYYRLCADQIQTPGLAQQLAGNPEEFAHLVGHVCRRVAGSFAEELTRDVLVWVREYLGSQYSWPGNFRELEQCVRNVMIRKEYHPPRLAAGGATPRQKLAEEFLDGTLSADGLLRRYCTLVYGQTGSYEETSRRLGLDRRTVKAKVDAELLKALQGG